MCKPTLCGISTTSSNTTLDVMQMFAYILVCSMNCMPLLCEGLVSSLLKPFISSTPHRISKAMVHLSTACLIAMLILFSRVPAIQCGKLYVSMFIYKYPKVACKLTASHHVICDVIRLKT